MYLNRDDIKVIETNRNNFFRNEEKSNVFFRNLFCLIFGCMLSGGTAFLGAIIYHGIVRESKSMEISFLFFFNPFSIGGLFLTFLFYKFLWKANPNQSIVTENNSFLITELIERIDKFFTIDYFFQSFFYNINDKCVGIKYLCFNVSEKKICVVQPSFLTLPSHHCNKLYIDLSINDPHWKCDYIFPPHRLPLPVNEIHWIYDYSQILGFEIIRNNEIISKISNNKSGAIVTGGLLFGAVGAIVGAIAGGAKSSISEEVTKSLFIKIVIDDKDNPVIMLPFWDYALTSILPKKIIDKANFCQILLELAMMNANIPKELSFQRLSNLKDMIELKIKKCQQNSLNKNQITQMINESLNS